MIVGDIGPYPTYKDSGLPWLAQVPEGWGADAVKRHYAIQLGKMLQGGRSAPSDREVAYLKAQHVQWFAVRTSAPPKMWASPSDIEQYGVKAGDLLVCEGGEGGRCGILREIPESYIIQNALHRVRPLGHCRNDYLQWVMSAIAATGWFEAINSKATIAHFTREKFGALRIPVPTPGEQDAIVRFLDHADRRIRRYIAAKRRLIALLNEQKQTAIHRAVTRGLDPFVSTRPSGVEWLGDVPEHWEVAPLRRRWTVTDCKHLTVPFVEEGIPLASVREVQSFDLDLSTSKRTTMDWYETLIGGGRAPRRGDVIYCRNVSVGAAAFVSTDAPFAMGQDVCLIRSANQNQRYLNYFLHSPAMDRELAMLLVGSTFKRINVSDIKGLIIAMPPRAEQDAIAAHLDQELDHLERPISDAHLQIGLMREYRARLIADVVTGKLDVREAAVRLPNESDEPEPSDDADALAEGDESENEADLGTAAGEAEA